MDKLDNEPLLLSKTNRNLEHLRKAYANGGISMAEILHQMPLSMDLESMVTAAHTFIPPELLNNIPDLETSIKSSNQIQKDKIPTLYIPGKVFFIENKNSCLNKREQAICLNALKLRQGGYTINGLRKLQQEDLTAAMELQSKVQAENAQFLEYVKNDWNAKQSRGIQLKASLKTYAYQAWQRKLKLVLDYPQFYKTENVICLSRPENESQVSVNHIENLHELGTVPKFVGPCFDVKHALKISTLPLQEEFKAGSKLPVSRDPTVENLIKTSLADIVISSSGLKQLMDDTNSNTEWHIPVVVKKHNMQDNTEKSVVYIDKPIAKRFPTPADFNYYCQKLMVKTNLCCFPGITFNASDVSIPSDTLTDDVETETETSYQIKKKQLDLNKSIDYIEELHEFSALVGRNKKDENKFDIERKRKIFHNVSYRLWSMKGIEQNELLKSKFFTKDVRVLIRCKLDACERSDDGSIRPLVVVPKIEYQLEHGANVPTKKEIIDQWTALFFKPFSHLYRIRMQSDVSEIVNVQSVNLQKLNTEASSLYDYKPHLRLDNIYQIFSLLTDLKPGNYLLSYSQDKGPFVEVLSECDGRLPGDKFNLHTKYSPESCFYTIPNCVPWTPIDTTYILPVHNTFKRMPGMFKPLLKQQLKAKKKNNKKRKSSRLKKSKILV